MRTFVFLFVSIVISFGSFHVSGFSLRIDDEEEPVVLTDGNYIVVGSFVRSANADNYRRILNNHYHNARLGYHAVSRHYYVFIFDSPDIELLKRILDEVRKVPQFKDAWILRVGNAREIIAPVTTTARIENASTVIDSPQQTSIIENDSSALGYATNISALATDESINEDNEKPVLPVVTNPGTKEKFGWSLRVMPFYRGTQFRDGDGTINPENRVAKLSSNDISLYIRPEFQYKVKGLSVWAKPRCNIDFDADNGNIKNENSYNTEFYFQQLKGKIQLTKGLSLTGGRYVKLMGPSIFLNPSNPFFINPGRLNPKIEIRPMDLVELNYATDKNWSFTLVANVGAGESDLYKSPYFKFNRNYGLLAEYFGESENLGFIASMDEDEKSHLGMYGQKNVTDAIIVWFDGSLDNNIDRFYPQTGHSTKLLNYEMVNGNDNRKIFGTGLIGCSYTTSFGPTFQVEYFYNGKGYSRSELNNFYDMINTAYRYNFDVTRDLSNLNLGRAINPGLPYIRNNYIFTQISDTDVFDVLNYNFRYLYSVDDNSSQISSLVEISVLNNLEVFGVGLKNFGTKRSDLNRLVNSQIMAGVMLKF